MTRKKIYCVGITLSVKLLIILHISTSLTYISNNNHNHFNCIKYDYQSKISCIESKSLCDDDDEENHTIHFDNKKYRTLKTNLFAQENAPILNNQEYSFPNFTNIPFNCDKIFGKRRQFG